MKRRQINKQAPESVFLEVEYQKHNIARLSHLESLGLDLSGKNVLELGAGIGDHTLFYLYKGCKVTPVEGRQELCDLITKRFGIQSIKIDFEDGLDELSKLTDYDIVHCYGLLYHLSNPSEFLKIACKGGSLFLLETCVSTDDVVEQINIVDENINDKTQAISGKGCRPTRKWLFTELSKFYPYVYCPITQPKHPEFRLDLRERTYDNQLSRAIFIGSQSQIINKKLLNAIPDLYQY